MKLAIVFDFDDTLCHDSTSAFLKHKRVDVEDFWNNKVARLIAQGWDPVPAYLYQLIEVSKTEPITRTHLKDFGAYYLLLHQGLDSFVKKVKHFIVPLYHEFDVELEFFIISSGIYDIIASSSLSHDVKQIWGSQFHYNEAEEIVFPKQIISFTDKTRYLYYIQKGMLGKEYFNKPFDVNKKVENAYIPFEHFIYIGDGYTDIPCFSLITKHGGKAVGVYNNECSDSEKRAWGLKNENRIMEMFEADYTSGSDLYNYLLGIIQEILDKKVKQIVRLGEN